MRIRHSWVIFTFIFLLFALLFQSCSKSEGENSAQKTAPLTINLKDRFYWAPCDADSTIEDAEKLRFSKFSTKGFSNIRKVAGENQEYVWLMAVFPLPEELREKNLGLLISYLHFAEKVWVNGVYVGGYGEFPPNAKSSLWGAHFYSIPDTLLNPVGRNIMLIKVYCKGRSGISNRILIGEQKIIDDIDTFYTFTQSIIYLFAEGGMFFTAIFFLLVYVGRKKDKEFISFSLLCMSSMVFATPFFASQIPLNYPTDVPFLFFMKFTLGISFYLIAFFLARLITEFIKKPVSRIFKILRAGILTICVLVTLFVPNYDALMLICPFMLALSAVQFILPFISIFRSELTEEEKRSLVILLTAFIPIFIAIALDVIIKGIIQKVDTPYATLFGWLITIFDFMVIMSIRYNKAVAQNEYLNVKLRREVLKQTRELSKKNAHLEEQITRSEADLEMASIVQKKFFPYPPRSLKGWDIAVSYSPLDKVSGDMYDFYIDNETGELNGFSLFDVSGHGIAASLVTMLAKNIIFQSFLRNMKKKETVSRTLYEINKEIIEAKGEIENYLTGVMFRLEPFDKNDDCKVLTANAGHPNPILYSAKSNICDEIETTEEHIGAIGLDFIEVSFPQIEFTMSEDDILVFYTDGVTESRNKKGEMFGRERLKKIIKENFAKDAQSIMEEIIDSLNSFTKGTKRDDDITLVVMKRENSGNYVEELFELDGDDDFLG